MVLHVGGLPDVVHLDVGGAVEIRLHHGQTGLPRIIGKDPAHRMSDRENPSAAGPEHACDLSHHRCRVRDERHRAERRARQVETVVSKRQSRGVGLHQWDADSGLPGRVRRMT